MMYKLSVCVLFLLLSIFCVYAQDGDGEQQNQQQTDQEELDVALNEGLKPFYKMTHLFLEYIQPNNISAEILSKELKEYDELSDFFDAVDAQFWVDHFKGYIACVAIGVIFFVGMLLTGLIFCCCRCCNNCGGDSKEIYEDRSDTYFRRCYGVTLLLLNTFFFTWVVLAFLTNEMLRKQTEQSPDAAVPQILEGVEILEQYQIDTIQEIEGYLITTLEEGLGTMIHTLEGLPAQAVALVPAISNADALVQQTEQLLTATTALTGHLQSVQVHGENINDQQGDLNDDINAFKAAIAGVDCQGVASCESLQTTVASLTEVSALPSVDDELSALQAILAADFEELVTTATEEFNEVSSEIDTETQTAINEVNTEKVNIETEAHSIFDTVQEDTVQEMNTTDLQNDLKEFQEDLEEYGNYRWYGGLAICCILLLVVLFNFLGLLFGFFGDPPFPGASGCNRGVGGKFLMLGVYCSFLFGWLIMIVITILFIIGGGLYSEICTVLIDIDSNPSIDIIAEPYITDLPINISVNEVYTSCKNNTAAFTALNLNQIVDLGKLNLSNYGLEAELNELKAVNIDLSAIDFSSDDLDTQLDALSTAGLDDIDFDAFTAQLNNDILNGDTLRDYKTTIESIPGTPGLAEIDALIATVNNLEPDVTGLSESLTETEAVIDGTSTGGNNFEDTVASVRTELDTAQQTTQTQGAQQIEFMISETVDTIWGTAQRILDDLVYVVEYKAGGCKPIYTATTHVIDTVCYAVLDPFNGFWAAVGWCLLLMVPNIIIAVKLASLYRKYEDSDPHASKSFDDPNFDHYQGHNDNIPLEDHPHIIRANKRNPAPVQGYGNAGSSYPNSPPHQSQAPPAYGGRYDTQQSYPGYREPQPQEPYSGTQGHYSNYPYN